MTIPELLKLVVDKKGSDLHLSVGVPPMMRIDGDLQAVPGEPLSKEQVEQMLAEVMTDFQQKEFADNLEVDFSYELPNISRYRVNVFNQNRGVAAAFRTIPSKVLSLDDLNMPHLKKFCRYQNGLVLVTGPTGSGKTTTLAAMINEINANDPAHILTVEDPVEFVHTSQKSLVNQRELIRDTHSFSNALRVALREDPDVILVGEMRDLETIRLALTAAETGHLVFGTLHTSSAAKTIDRVINVFPSDEQAMIRSMLSGSLRAVISQTLLKKIGGGRIAAQEIMISTSAIRNLIRENKVAQMYSTIQTGQSEGMQTLDAHLQKLLKEKMISRESAELYMLNKEGLLDVA
jgi:twitching motility protein PilT